MSNSRQCRTKLPHEPSSKMAAVLTDLGKETRENSMRSPDRCPRILLVAPFGAGVGGILAQTNALVSEIQKVKLASVIVIDTAQRYREDFDLRLKRRVVGGIIHATKLLGRLLNALATFRPESVRIASSASLGLFRDFALVLLARAFRAHVVISFHFGRIPSLRESHNWEWWLLLSTCAVSDGVVVLDARSKNTLKSALPRTAIEQFPNGIDIDWVDNLVRGIQQSPESSKVRLVFTGMVIQGKGVVELVNACAQLKNSNFELEIVGPVSPDMKKRLYALASSGPRVGWVTFTGPLAREDSIRKIASADIYVLPSYTEGFPISILEAMACGKPTVATAVGAITEMLSIDSAHPAGICVPSREAGALSCAIASLIEDPARRAAMGKAAREKCKSEYSLSNLARRWVALLTRSEND